MMCVGCMGCTAKTRVNPNTNPLLTGYHLIMTRDEIIAMAREVDCLNVDLHGDQVCAVARLTRFADLVTSKERQRCQSVCEGVKDKSRNHLFRSGAAICAGVLGDVEFPEPAAHIGGVFHWYTHIQLRDYGDRRAAAEREKLAAWIEPQRNDVPATGAEFAAAIRYQETS